VVLLGVSGLALGGSAEPPAWLRSQAQLQARPIERRLLSVKGAYRFSVALVQPAPVALVGHPRLQGPDAAREAPFCHQPDRCPSLLRDPLLMFNFLGTLRPCALERFVAGAFLLFPRGDVAAVGGQVALLRH
jgi:hypothetical protein